MSLVEQSGEFRGDPLIRDFETRWDKVNAQLSVLTGADHGHLRREVPFKDLPSSVGSVVRYARGETPATMPIWCITDFVGNEIISPGYPKKIFRCFVLKWEETDPDVIAQVHIYPKSQNEGTPEERLARTVRNNQNFPANAESVKARGYRLGFYLTTSRFDFFKLPVLEGMLIATNPAIPFGQGSSAT